MRVLTATDARDMAAIHAVCFDRPWDALEMATHTQRDFCLGADWDNQLAAFVILSITADQSEVLTIATSKPARRQGLAKQILTNAFEMLQKRDITETFLEVAEDNIGAMALYKGLGFQPIGRRPGYYRRADGRVAAITFSKKL